MSPHLLRPASPMNGTVTGSQQTQNSQAETKENSRAETREKDKEWFGG